MGLEIERKFLLRNDGWRKLAQGKEYRQGYLSSVKERSVRIRTIEDTGYLTIKGVSKGAVRMEYEYVIPVDEAREMLEALCEKPLIEKKRFKIPYQGLIWEVDEFFGENQGLLVAEVELSSETQAFQKPEWVDVEVTHDSRYFNANLVHHPFNKW
ncbi:CYTH domain-containing protein [Desulfococcaceae bacterium HSG9]|nr:CYTH domain-containing protein [Desulfococcaceae bacterium HSG9]